jgi:murein DD-endopeptidase MepM/ murein hydrolase activator NlpD
LKFKKYLLELTSTSGSSGFKKACTVNFQAGAPVAVVRDGYLVYVHKNGTEEYLDSKGKVVKVAHHD